MSVLGAIVGLITLFSLRKGRTPSGTPEITPEILANEKEIAHLNGRREAVSERIERVDEQISKLDARIDEETKNLNLRKKEVENMTLEEKAKRFEELGY